ncbi:MAG TPA: UbiA family prenyltransferase [Gemmatimonadales bacterium]|nr:UbiA family prenyltransferase [Gemmatimonadales bacterium]
MVVSRARAAGYRLVGRKLDYLLHLRPAEWPIMAAHAALGYLLAVGLASATGEHLGRGLLGLLLWVVCLNGGTLALNSAFDRDEGDIAYLRNPPPPPERLALFSLGLMAAGQLAALVLPPLFAALYGLCFALSILYSVPPFRLKAVGGVDWLINMIGFGTLTPLAGWATTGRPVGSDTGIVLLAFCPLFAALYPLTQLYQLEEDARRGDRTLALRLGIRRSLDVALAATAAAFLLFAWAGTRSPWHPAAAGWRWSLLLIALLAWAAVLVPWRRAGEDLQPGDHQRRMYLALGAWAVTDLAVLLAWGS